MVLPLVLNKLDQTHMPDVLLLMMEHTIYPSEGIALLVLYRLLLTAHTIHFKVNVQDLTVNQFPTIGNVLVPY